MSGRGWTPEGTALVERAWTAHGGLDRWRAVETISLTPTTLSGLLPALKGLGRTFTLPARVDVSPHRGAAVFRGYPDPGCHGVFERGSVRIELVATGAVIDEGAGHRAPFDRQDAFRHWSPLDALYVFGHALWHYHTLPFTLLEARCLRAERVRVAGLPLEVLEVEFDADAPAHARRRTFYFDETGRIARHDEVAEGVGPWAQATHRWLDYQIVDGVAVATRRHMVARIGRRAMPLTVLRAAFGDIRVALAHGGSRSAAAPPA